MHLLIEIWKNSYIHLAKKLFYGWGVKWKRLNSVCLCGFIFPHFIMFFKLLTTNLINPETYQFLFFFFLSPGTHLMIIMIENDFRRWRNRSWENYCSLVYFDVKILLFLQNTLIIKFDDVMANWFLFKIYC